MGTKSRHSKTSHQECWGGILFGLLGLAMHSPLSWEKQFCTPASFFMGGDILREVQGGSGMIICDIGMIWGNPFQLFLYL